MIERPPQDLCSLWETLLSHGYQRSNILLHSQLAKLSMCCYFICLSYNFSKEFVEGVGMPQVKTIEICIDNKSVITLSKNPIFYYQSKHIDICYHYIWECIKSKEIQAKYVKSHDQITDILSEPLSKKISSS